MYHMYLYIHTHVAFLGVQRNGICWWLLARWRPRVSIHELRWLATHWKSPKVDMPCGNPTPPK